MQATSSRVATWLGGVGPDRPATAGPATSPPLAASIRAAVVPFLVSRLLVLVPLLAARPGGGSRFTLDGLLYWDGGWYLRIATFGFGPPPVDDVASNWPFFPLYPGLARGLSELGVPLRMSLVVISHVGFALALVGIHRLAARHLGPARAPLAVWVLALVPATAVFSMAYPSGLLLAASVWAFVLVEERRDLAAGLVGGLAAMVRPNGLVVVAGLFVVLAVDQRLREHPAQLVARAVRVCGPGVAAVAVWCGLQWHWTGSPLTFWTSKSAWDEVQLWEFAARPRPSEVPHVVVGLAALALVLACRRWLPRGWIAFAVLYLAPALLLGVVGMARYGSECFPVAIAATGVLGRVPPAVRTAILALAALGAVAVALAIIRTRIVP